MKLIGEIIVTFITLIGYIIGVGAVGLVLIGFIGLKKLKIIK